MNYVAVGLMVLVLFYLQFHFLSLLNVIVIGLLAGIYIAFESKLSMIVIFAALMSVIILASFVFKIITLVKTIFDFTGSVDESGNAPITTYYYNRVGTDELPNDKEFVELDLSKELKDLSCKEDFAPSKFVDGVEAKQILDKCSTVCASHDDCELVIMMNQGGKNNDCRFFKTADKNVKIDGVKSKLEALNNTEDMMKATNYALIQK